MLAQTGVSAIVGARVFPVRIPSEVWDSATKKPCLAYSVLDVARSQTFCETIPLQNDSVTVNCYARTYDDCQNLANAIKGVIDFRGLVGQTKFKAVFLETESDSLDIEPGLYLRILTFAVWNRGVQP